jgi:ankyrin repeat protein
MLLEKGANPDFCDCFGYTPLMNAVKNNHVEVARMLIENSSDRRVPSDQFARPALANDSSACQDPKVWRVF